MTSVTHLFDMVTNKKAAGDRVFALMWGSCGRSFTARLKAFAKARAFTVLYANVANKRWKALLMPECKSYLLLAVWFSE